MNRLLAGILCAAALAVLSPAAARADSEPYFVTIATIQASGTVTISTAPAVGLSGHVFKHYALQVTGVGAAASAWAVTLDGSLDGLTFTNILTHASATGSVDGSVITSSGSAVMPMFYFRAKITSLTLGSSTGLTVKALGTQ